MEPKFILISSDLPKRLHPIALAVVAALDIGMKLIGNGSRIIAEFSIGAEIEGSFEGFYNMATGENSFNSNDRKTMINILLN